MITVLFIHLLVYCLSSPLEHKLCDNNAYDFFIHFLFQL